MNKQITMSYFEDELKQVKTRKKEFLEQMDKIIPWGKWLRIIRPCYYKGERGNKPYELELMLRIYVLQNMYNLSDMGIMTELIDSRAFSEFCGIESSNQVPDGDMIGRFRNILVRNNIQEKLFKQIVATLKEQGLILKKGTIVDSTIIASPSSTKNKEKKRDPEAHSVKKGNTWYFGYKAHVGVDKDTGLVHDMEVTSANIHDVTVMDQLLTGDEEEVYGDSGYLGAQDREEAKIVNNSGNNIEYQINMRPSQMKNIPKDKEEEVKQQEHLKSSVRSKVEHVFCVVKNKFQYRKTRYRGLHKQTQKLNMMFALANLYLANKKIGVFC